MNRIMTGALAGLAATLPMTAAMVVMHRLLPEEESYPLPPRTVAMKMAGQVGIEKHLDEPQRRAVTLAAHFGYGAASGAIYAPLARRLPLSPAAGGACFGLAVWAGSYLGWLPAAGVLPPVTKHPARRTALMITAHVVWGVAAGVMVDRVTKSEREDEAG